VLRAVENLLVVWGTWLRHARYLMLAGVCMAFVCVFPAVLALVGLKDPLVLFPVGEVEVRGVEMVPLDEYYCALAVNLSVRVEDPGGFSEGIRELMVVCREGEWRFSGDYVEGCYLLGERSLPWFFMIRNYIMEGFLNVS